MKEEEPIGWKKGREKEDCGETGEAGERDKDLRGLKRHHSGTKRMGERRTESRGQRGPKKIEAARPNTVHATAATHLQCPLAPAPKHPREPLLGCT